AAALFTDHQSPFTSSTLWRRRSRRLVLLLLLALVARRRRVHPGIYRRRFFFHLRREVGRRPVFRFLNRCFRLRCVRHRLVVFGFRRHRRRYLRRGGSGRSNRFVLLLVRFFFRRFWRDGRGDRSGYARDRRDRSSRRRRFIAFLVFAFVTGRSQDRRRCRRH